MFFFSFFLPFLPRAFTSSGYYLLGQLTSSAKIEEDTEEPKGMQTPTK
jgi:hypothetical protein